MRLRHEPQKILSVVEGVHDIDGHVPMTEVIFQLCQRASVCQTFDFK